MGWLSDTIAEITSGGAAETETYNSNDNSTTTTTAAATSNDDSNSNSNSNSSNGVTATTLGAVSANGSYAGDGFEWVQSSNTNALTRTYTGANEGAGLGYDTIHAPSSDAATKAIIANISLNEGSAFAASQTSATDGSVFNLFRSDDDQVGSGSYAEQVGTVDYTPTITYDSTKTGAENTAATPAATPAAVPVVEEAPSYTFNPTPTPGGLGSLRPVSRPTNILTPREQALVAAYNAVPDSDELYTPDSETMAAVLKSQNQENLTSNTSAVDYDSLGDLDVRDELNMSVGERTAAAALRDGSDVNANYTGTILPAGTSELRKLVETKNTDPGSLSSADYLKALEFERTQGTGPDSLTSSQATTPEIQVAGPVTELPSSADFAMPGTQQAAYSTTMGPEGRDPYDPRTIMPTSGQMAMFDGTAQEPVNMTPEGSITQFIEDTPILDNIIGAGEDDTFGEQLGLAFTAGGGDLLPGLALQGGEQVVSAGLETGRDLNLPGFDANFVTDPMFKYRQAGLGDLTGLDRISQEQELYRTGLIEEVGPAAIRLPNAPTELETFLQNAADTQFAQLDESIAAMPSEAQKNLSSPAVTIPDKFGYGPNQVDPAFAAPLNEDPSSLAYSQYSIDPRATAMQAFLTAPTALATVAASFVNPAIGGILGGTLAGGEGQRASNTELDAALSSGELQNTDAYKAYATATDAAPQYASMTPAEKDSLIVSQMQNDVSKGLVPLNLLSGAISAATPGLLKSGIPGKVVSPVIEGVEEGLLEKVLTNASLANQTGLERLLDPEEVFSEGLVGAISSAPASVGASFVSPGSPVPPAMDNTFVVDSATEGAPAASNVQSSYDEVPAAEQLMVDQLPEYNVDEARSLASEMLLDGNIAFDGDNNILTDQSTNESFQIDPKVTSVLDATTAIILGGSPPGSRAVPTPVSATTTVEELATPGQDGPSGITFQGKRDLLSAVDQKLKDGSVVRQANGRVVPATTPGGIAPPNITTSAIEENLAKKPATGIETALAPVNNTEEQLSLDLSSAVDPDISLEQPKKLEVIKVDEIIKKDSTLPDTTTEEVEEIVEIAEEQGLDTNDAAVIKNLTTIYHATRGAPFSAVDQSIAEKTPGYNFGASGPGFYGSTTPSYPSEFVGGQGSLMSAQVDTSTMLDAANSTPLTTDQADGVVRALSKRKDGQGNDVQVSREGDTLNLTYETRKYSDGLTKMQTDTVNLKNPQDVFDTLKLFANQTKNPLYRDERGFSLDSNDSADTSNLRDILVDSGFTGTTGISDSGGGGRENVVVFDPSTLPELETVIDQGAIPTTVEELPVTVVANDAITKKMDSDNDAVEILPDGGAVVQVAETPAGTGSLDKAASSAQGTIDNDRIRTVLGNAKKQLDAGSMQLVSKTGAQSLVDAGLLNQEDTLANPIVLAKVKALLDAGPAGVNQILKDNAATSPVSKGPDDIIAKQRQKSLVADLIISDNITEESMEQLASQLGVDVETALVSFDEAMESMYSEEVVAASDEAGNKAATEAWANFEPTTTLGKTTGILSAEDKAAREAAFQTAYEDAAEASRKALFVGTDSDKAATPLNDGLRDGEATKLDDGSVEVTVDPLEEFRVRARSDLKKSKIVTKTISSTIDSLKSNGLIEEAAAYEAEANALADQYTKDRMASSDGTVVTKDANGGATVDIADTTVDTSTDTTVDTSTDTAVDTSTDTAVDTAATNTNTNTNTETESETETETETEIETEIGPYDEDDEEEEDVIVELEEEDDEEVVTSGTDDIDDTDGTDIFVPVTTSTDEDGNTINECPEGYEMVQTEDGPMCQKITKVVSSRQRAGAGTQRYTGGYRTGRGPGQARNTTTSTKTETVSPTTRIV